MFNQILLFIFCVFIIAIIYFIYQNYFKDNFFNGSGYGFNKKFSNINTLVPFNDITKSTDFKLFSLLSQMKFSMWKPSNFQKSQKTNVILFLGQGDLILKQNNLEVWPNNTNHINNNSKSNVYNNNTGHFNTINVLLENTGNCTVNTMLYDFRNINETTMNNLYKSFIDKLSKGNASNASNASNGSSLIIAYDFGAVIANILINMLPANLKTKIKKLLLICPTIGGTPMTIRDYFSKDGPLIENYDSVLLSMPDKKYYDLPVVIYNSLSYKCNNINELLKEENKPVKRYEELQKMKEMSFKNPNVETIIIANDQFSTPVCYNFRNDMKNPPERYLPKINNDFPNDDIHYNGSFEGISEGGDKVVPTNVIQKLHKDWNNNSKLEIIKDKDHFTILKSYELALIILANL